MIEVELPDGSIAEFPEGTDPSTIESALQQQFAPQQAGPSVGTGEDVARSTVAGVSQGATGLLGLPADMVGWAEQGADWLARAPARMLGYGDPADNLTPDQQRLLDQRSVGSTVQDWAGSEALQGYADTLSGGATAYEPQTLAGDYAKTGAAFVTGAAGSGARTAGGLIKYGVLPAVTSETAGQLTEGTAAEPYARLVGALAGSYLPAAGKRAIVGPRVKPEDAKGAAVLEREGVKVATGQKIGNTVAKGREAMMNPERAQAFQEDQLKAFTRAAARRAGADVDDLLPATLGKISDDIGSKFDDVIPSVRIQPTRADASDLKALIEDYKQASKGAQIVGRVQTVAKQLSKFAKMGDYADGRWYQNMRTKLQRDMMKQKDYTDKEAFKDLIEKLDEIAARSLTGEDLVKLKQARKEWRNFLTLDRAMSYAGQDTAAGLLTPNHLNQSIKAVQGKQAISRGTSDFEDLTRAGQKYLRPLPTSGTSERLLGALKMPMQIAAPMVGLGTGGPIGAAVGATAAATAPLIRRGVGAYRLSDSGRRAAENARSFLDPVRSVPSVVGYDANMGYGEPNAPPAPPQMNPQIRRQLIDSMVQRGGY